MNSRSTKFDDSGMPDAAPREEASGSSSSSAARPRSRVKHRRANAEGGGTNRFFTISEVAALVQVSKRTVQRWIDGGLLVVFRAGGIVRISEHDLLAFLARHRGL